MGRESGRLQSIGLQESDMTEQLGTHTYSFWKVTNSSGPLFSQLGMIIVLLPHGVIRKIK